MVPRVCQRFLATRSVFDVSLALALLIGFKADITRHANDKFGDVSNLLILRFPGHPVENLVCKFLRKRTLVPLEELHEAATKVPIFFPSARRFGIQPHE
jgi:hypothetical protein